MVKFGHKETELIWLSIRELSRLQSSLWEMYLVRIKISHKSRKKSPQGLENLNRESENLWLEMAREQQNRFLKKKVRWGNEALR